MLLLHEATNTTFIITLVTITTYHLLLKKKKVKYFLFLKLFDLVETSTSVWQVKREQEENYCIFWIKKKIYCVFFYELKKYIYIYIY